MCFGASGLGAIFMAHNPETNWYAQLDKPNFTPPDWIFGPVWTILYLIMAISFFLVWNRGLDFPKVKLSLMYFLIQLIMNAIWTPLFFGFHMILFAFIDITILWFAILVTILAFRRISLSASILLIPYLIWVGYAAILNGAIWFLNSNT